MAQLRDVKTGECIAEGTPVEVALLAREVGAETMFDDVGLSFDPASVIEAHEAELASLRELRAAAKGEEKAQLDERIIERDVSIDPAEAEERMKAAQELAG